MIHASMQYGLIQDQGHEGPKIAKMANFKVYLLSRRACMNSDTPTQYLNFCLDRFLIFIPVRRHVTFKVTLSIS